MHNIAHSEITVDGKPFFMNGVTYAKHNPSEEDFRKMGELGVNTIRTWGTGDTTGELLDMAAKHDLKVMLGIWMRHGRPGAEGDDSFNWISDEAGKEEQMKTALAAVAKYKDHPAVLAWGIGNEVTLNIATEPEKIAYAKYLEKVCRAVKELDPKHPVASVSAWTTDWPYWRDHCPSIELYGANVYGYSVYALPGEMEKMKIDKPFFLGEFGVSGEWEAKKDPNGVSIEPGDKEKHSIFADGWAGVKKESGEKFLGGYLFNFGDQKSFAGVWLDFFIEGAYRPSYWGAKKAFTGKDAPNSPPVIETLLVSKSKEPRSPGSWVKVLLEVVDKENDKMEISFNYNQRVGDRANRDAVLPLKWEKHDRENVYKVWLPDTAAPTKIYVFVRDSYPNMAIASASVTVR